MSQPSKYKPIVFKERSSYDYISIDEENTVRLMLPFTASSNCHISTDNTCKTLEEIGKFFGFNKKKGSALSVVNTYIADLEADLKSIDNLIFHDDDDKVAIQNIREQKLIRLLQLYDYRKLLQEKSLNRSVRSLYLGSTLGSFPKTVQTALESADNLFSMRLSPGVEDSYTKFTNPIFAVTRADKEKKCSSTGLGFRLRKITLPIVKEEAKKEEIKQAEKALIRTISENALKKLWANKHAEDPEKYPVCDIENLAITPEDFNTFIDLLDEEVRKHPGLENTSIKQLWENFFGQSGQTDLKEKKTVGQAWIKYYQEVGLGYFDDTETGKFLLEVVEDIVYPLQSTLNGPERTPIFSHLFEEKDTKPIIEIPDFTEDKKAQASNVENCSISIQFFLGLVNAHCYAQDLFIGGSRRTNMGAIFEQEELLNPFIERIQAAINTGNPVEDVIFDFINEHYVEFHLKNKLEREDIDAIKANFSELYTVFKEMPVHDESLIVLPNMKKTVMSVGHEYNGNICITIDAYLKFLEDNGKLHDRYFGQAANLSTKPITSTILPQVNSVSTEFTPKSAYTRHQSRFFLSRLIDLFVGKSLEYIFKKIFRENLSSPFRSKNPFSQTRKLPSSLTTSPIVVLSSPPVAQNTTQSTQAISYVPEDVNAKTKKTEVFPSST